VPRHPTPTALAAAALAGLAALAAACGGTRGAAGGGADIVVTTPVLGDVVAEVVGDLATVEVLMPPGADPHAFQPSARQAVALTEADLVVTAGGGLEAGLADAVEAAHDAGVPVFEAVDHVDPLPAGAHEGDDGHALDDGHDHDVDPHVTTDALRMVEVVEALAGAVADEVPGIDRGALAARAAAYVEELRRVDRAMGAEIARIPADRRVLVTDHHVFGYLADRWGFRIVGAVVPSPTTEAAPSARHLDELARAVAEHDVPAIFVEAGRDDRLARTLAEEIGDVEVVELYGETLGEPGSGAATYLDMMRTNASRLADALAPEADGR